MELEIIMQLFVFIWIVTACYASPVNQTLYNETDVANVSMQMNESSATPMCTEGINVKILDATILSEITENKNTTNGTISVIDSARDQCENKTCFVMNLDDTEVRDCYNETCIPWKVLINYECVPLVYNNAKPSSGKQKATRMSVIYDHFLEYSYAFNGPDVSR